MECMFGQECYTATGLIQGTRMSWSTTKPHKNVVPYFIYSGVPIHRALFLQVALPWEYTTDNCCTLFDRSALFLSYFFLSSLISYHGCMDGGILWPLRTQQIITLQFVKVREKYPIGNWCWAQSPSERKSNSRSRLWEACAFLSVFSTEAATPIIYGAKTDELSTDLNLGNCRLLVGATVRHGLHDPTCRHRSRKSVGRNNFLRFCMDFEILLVSGTGKTAQTAIGIGSVLTNQEVSYRKFYGSVIGLHPSKKNEARRTVVRPPLYKNSVDIN